jgi:hypothetical protein
MTGFALAAAAGVAAGLMIGAAATVGVTLAVQDHDMAPVPAAPVMHGPVGPYPVLARAWRPVAVTRRPGWQRPFC